MKNLKVFFIATLFFLPCVYYHPLDVVSLGHNVVDLVQGSYRSLFVDIAKVWT